MLIKSRDSVTSALINKVGNKPCPMCSKPAGFSVDVHEYQETSFNRNENGVLVTGEQWYVPCALMICNNCGYIIKFSLEKLLDDPGYLKTSIAK